MVARIPNDFFKTWTPEMAYVLGYGWADGGMLQTPRSCRVTFTSKDGDHLERIAYTLGIGKVVPTGNGCFRLTVYRKSMFEDLLELGGMPGKSLIATWPVVPSEFLKPFARGFIDGDGSLYWLSTAITTHPRVQAVGTQEFLRGMAIGIREQTGIPVPSCFANENMVYWLYENSELYLKRKRKIALEFLEWQPKLFHKRSVTPRMRELFKHLFPE